MDLKELTIEEINRIKDILISEYIGEWNKPLLYYSQLKQINNELKSRL
jgi:hypothetical protein